MWDALSVLLFPILGLLLGMADVYYYDWQFWAILILVAAMYVFARM